MGLKLANMVDFPIEFLNSSKKFKMDIESLQKVKDLQDQYDKTKSII